MESTQSKAKEARENILTSNSFVLEELTRLQFLYGLKYEMRYGQGRDDSSGADSVAEHLYGMHIALHYFLPLEDQKSEWDVAKMLTMITWHDIDEVVTGDIIGYDKTDEHRKAEAEATLLVYQKLPEHMKLSVQAVLDEYNARETMEAKFVKAVDKIEPMIHLYTPEGKDLLQRMGTTRKLNASIKIPFYEGFPTLRRFYDVIADRMEEEGYFC